MVSPGATLPFPPASAVVRLQGLEILPLPLLEPAGETNQPAWLTVVDETATDALPFVPSLVAVIVAVPGATAVTRPLALTVAAAALLVAQVIVRPVRVLPAESLVVAVSCCVAAGVRLTAAGATATAATGTRATVTEADALLPPLVAVIVAPPA